MRDQFVGDIGDYAKYSLFNVLARGRKAGVAWYRTPDQDNMHGSHVSYLNDPRWGRYDKEVFDGLRELQANGERSIAAVERAGIVKAHAFSCRLLELDDIPVKARAAWREGWFQDTLSDLVDCDFIFADPDNGLYLDERFSPARKDKLRYIPISEVRRLAEYRPAMIYHHHGFVKKAELIGGWRSVLGGNVIAVCFGAWGLRSFFIINPDQQMRDAVAEWASRWPKVEVFDACF